MMIGWQSTPDDDTWTNWSPLNGPPAGIGSAATARNQDGRLDFFGTDKRGKLWINWQTVAGRSWANWADLTSNSGPLNSVTAERNADGRLELVAVDSYGYAKRRRQLTPGGSWESWSELGSTWDKTRFRP